MPSQKSTSQVDTKRLCNETGRPGNSSCSPLGTELLCRLTDRRCDVSAMKETSLNSPLQPLPTRRLHHDRQGCGGGLMSHGRTVSQGMVSSHSRGLAAVGTQLFSKLRNAHRGLKAEPRSLRYGEGLGSLAEGGVRPEEPMTTDIKFLREDDLVHWTHVQRLDLADCQDADVVEVPAGSEIEN